ncbi:MAG: DNA polymerase III subunit delta [Chloroflexota bacterium]
MSTSKNPGIHLFYGDDEFAISEHLEEIKGLMGDPTTAGLNCVNLEGKTATFDSLRNATQSLPFLADYRLVVLVNPLSMTKSPSDRDTFKSFLRNIPTTTMLILIIFDEKERGSWKTLKNDHWLIKWSQEHLHSSAEQFHVREFPIPRGPDLVRFLYKEYKGSIQVEAISRLIELIGDEPRIAKMEIEKLLAYVNYQRPIDISDVETLTTNVREENIFDFVDALGNRNCKEAAHSLSRLLEQQDWQTVFGMTVRQFRLLLQTCEIVDFQGREDDIMRQVRGVNGNRMATKLIMQSKRFRIIDLENIYRRLIEIDEEIKTGKTEANTALYTFIAEFTE